MPIMAPLTMASSPSHDLPRRLGSLVNASLVSSTTQANPTHDGDGDGDDGGDGSEVMAYTFHDADDEDQGFGDYLDDDEEEEEDEEEVGHDHDDAKQDEESLLHPEHHNCPVHHQQSFLHETP